MKFVWGWLVFAVVVFNVGCRYMLCRNCVGLDLIVEMLFVW